MPSPSAATAARRSTGSRVVARRARSSHTRNAKHGSCTLKSRSAHVASASQRARSSGGDRSVGTGRPRRGMTFVKAQYTGTPA